MATPLPLSILAIILALILVIFGGAACGRSSLLTTQDGGGQAGFPSTPGSGGSAGGVSAPGGAGGATWPTPSGPAWPMAGHDPQRTRRSPADTRTNTGRLKWSYTLGGSESAVSGDPIIGADGTVYVLGRNQALQAITGPVVGTAEVRSWSYQVPPDPSPGESPSPALAPDGTVYVTSDRLYAIALLGDAAAGVLKWSYQPGAFELLGQPTVGADGTVYAVGSVFYAIRPAADGSGATLAWAFNNLGSSASAIGTDGTAYVFTNSRLTAVGPGVTATGSLLKWSYNLASGTVWTIGLGADGMVYVGPVSAPGGNTVYAIRPPASGDQGQLVWTYSIPGNHIFPGTAIGADGTVYFVTSGGTLYAAGLPEGGTVGGLKWSYSVPSTNVYTASSPVLGGDGTVYVRWDGHVYALSPPATGTSGSLKWTFDMKAGQGSELAIGNDGTIYVAGFDGSVATLYAIH